MDSGKYIDFNGKEHNEFYVVDTLDDNVKFRRVKSEYAIAGDSDSCYMKLPPNIDKLPIDEIVEVCDEIVECVNLEYPDFLKKAFNIPDSRLDSMVSNREVVSDKSLFVTKKRYAMHVVDDEGKRVDKYKIMGLEVKKADTSKAVKEFLMKTIHLIMDGGSREDLIEARDKFKKEFYQLSIRDIGVPMPSTKLRIYEDRYKFQGDMKSFPYHVRAAMFYNSLCGSLDRKILVGEKFFVCDAKHMDSKYIACPVDLNEVPEVVSNIPINYDSMWKKANKKITNYMKSMGWDLDSIKKEKSKALFGF